MLETSSALKIIEEWSDLKTNILLAISRVTLQRVWSLSFKVESISRVFLR